MRVIQSDQLDWCWEGPVHLSY